MKAASVLQCLSAYRFSQKRVEAIATELRKADLLPKAGRGLHSPAISPEQAILFALAVAGAERVVDAVTTAEALAELVQKQDRRRLVDVMAEAVFHAATLGRGIRHIRVIPAANMAEITWTEGEISRFFPVEAWDRENFIEEAQGQGFAGRMGHIGGGVLQQMAADHFHNDQDEMGELVDE